MYTVVCKLHILQLAVSSQMFISLTERQRYNRARGNDRLQSGFGKGGSNYGGKKDSDPFKSSSNGAGNQSTNQISSYNSSYNTNSYSGYSQPSSAGYSAPQPTPTFTGNTSGGILPTPGSVHNQTANPNMYSGANYSQTPMYPPPPVQGIAYQSYQQQGYGGQSSYAVPPTAPYYMPPPPPPPPGPAAQPPPPPQ